MANDGDDSGIPGDTTTSKSGVFAQGAPTLDNVNVCDNDHVCNREKGQQTSPDSQALGAGILCFAVAPHTGEIFFLLGKESGGAGDARLDCELPPPLPPLPSGSRPAHWRSAWAPSDTVAFDHSAGGCDEADGPFVDKTDGTIGAGNISLVGEHPRSAVRHLRRWFCEEGAPRAIGSPLLASHDVPLCTHPNESTDSGGSCGSEDGSDDSCDGSGGGSREYLVGMGDAIDFFSSDDEGDDDEDDVDDQGIDEEVHSDGISDDQNENEDETRVDDHCGQNRQHDHGFCGVAGADVSRDAGVQGDDQDGKQTHGPNHECHHDAQQTAILSDASQAAYVGQAPLFDDVPLDFGSCDPHNIGNGAGNGVGNGKSANDGDSDDATRIVEKVEKVDHNGHDDRDKDCDADAHDSKGRRFQARVQGERRPNGERRGWYSGRRQRRVHRWSDFGGRVEEGESEEQAAAREFFEETLGLVCTDTCRHSAHADTARGSVDVGARAGPHGNADRHALADDLAKGHYAFKVRTCLNYGADAGTPRRYHVTFVKQVPWMPGVVLQFARLRSDLAAIRRHARQFAPAPSAMSASSVSLSSSSLQSPMTTQCAIAMPSAPDPSSAGKAESIGHTPFPEDRAASPPCDQNNSHADQTLDTDQVERGKESDAPRCARIDDIEPEARAALDPHGLVRSEYIEKDYIQFWSVRRLRQALDNGGCFRREHLRPLFVPVVAAVLDAMAPIMPPAPFLDMSERMRDVQVGRQQPVFLPLVRAHALLPHSDRQQRDKRKDVDESVVCKKRIVLRGASPQLPLSPSFFPPSASLSSSSSSVPSFPPTLRPHGLVGAPSESADPDDAQVKDAIKRRVPDKTGSDECDACNAARRHPTEQEAETCAAARMAVIHDTTVDWTIQDADASGFDQGARAVVYTVYCRMPRAYTNHRARYPHRHYPYRGDHTHRPVEWPGKETPTPGLEQAADDRKSCCGTSPVS